MTNDTGVRDTRLAALRFDDSRGWNTLHGYLNLDWYVYPKPAHPRASWALARGSVLQWKVVRIFNVAYDSVSKIGARGFIFDDNGP